jgi:hypothetical protein
MDRLDWALAVLIVCILLGIGCPQWDVRETSIVPKTSSNCLACHYNCWIDYDDIAPEIREVIRDMEGVTSG